MKKIERIVLIKNAVETLGYFSIQLAHEFEKVGVDTFFVDYDHLFESLEALPHFVKRGSTALLTFNFIGLSGEDVFFTEDGSTIWEHYGMEYWNILVDHPMYYHSKLVKYTAETSAGTRGALGGSAINTDLQPLARRTKMFCIDREHVAYVKRFYPGVEVDFLPIAGNKELSEASFLTPYSRRKYDLVFTANYVAFDDLYQKVKAMAPDYRQFYRDILDDLLSNPAQSVDAVMERHIDRELGAVTDAEKCSAMAGMVLIDLCTRAYFREQILTELANGGCRIHLFGADWNRLRDNAKLCKCPENLILNQGQVSSDVCVRAMADTKIALNVMPWFKDGAHDRIFTAMLQGTLVLTDDSRYLREQFTDGEDIVFYSLAGKKGTLGRKESLQYPCLSATVEPLGMPVLSGLSEFVQSLLADEVRMEQIAAKGYDRARRYHTWKQRAKKLLEG